MRAQFSSVLEHIAFKLAPRNPHEDHGASSDEHWQEAWLQITYGRYPKAVACEAIGISDHAYDERRRRPRAKAGGLSIRDEELLTWLREQVNAETKLIEDQRQGRDYSLAIASHRGIRVPKSLRMPAFSKATRSKLPPDCRFLDDDRIRWKAGVARQPRCAHALWRKLIRLREERLAGVAAAVALHSWIEERSHAPTPGNVS